MKNLLKEELKMIEDKIINHRRVLHQTPEIGLELPQTSSYVKKVLSSLNLEIQKYVNGNGLSVLINGTKPNFKTSKVLALRADMDGLPINEETNHSFSSLNGNMHACGHDGHTAILLGVAEFLSKNTSLFSGSVKLIFQPGEEYPGGALPMIEEGVLENPDVNRVIGFHIGQLEPNIISGKISFKDGPLMASMDRFSIKIIGKGYHGAYPEYSNDPIIAASQLINSIQTIKSRNISATDPSVVSVTHIEGGSNQNIIPDEVLLEGTVRTVNNKIRKKIHSRLDIICRGISEMYELDCKLFYEYKYPPVINDITSTKETYESLSKYFGKEAIIKTGNPLMGAEDFSYFAERVPSTFMFFSNPGYIEGKFHGHHSSKFDINEEYLITVAEAFIVITLDYLTN